VFSLRFSILAIVAFFALMLGAVFAYPSARRGFARVELKDARLLVEVARDPAAHAKGLSERSAIPELGGMLFLFDKPDHYSMWMKEMRFPIDIFWVRNGMVVDLEEEVAPPLQDGLPSSRQSGLPSRGQSFLPIYRPDVPADMVLETRAGVAKKYRITIGDRVRISFGTSEGAKNAESPDKDEAISPAVAESAPPPHAPYTIRALRNAAPRGRAFKIGQLLLKTDAYEKHAISYQSGDLAISGVMNIPLAVPPEGGFPVLILNHGLIPSEIYFSGRGSKREQDFFARHGYITIHPDYRGLSSSSPSTNAHHDFYVGYTEDVAALIDALGELASPLMNLKRLGMWGHSMGGGIAARVAVLRPEVRAYVLFAPISADAEDNFYELAKEEVAWLHDAYGAEGAPAYREISPTTFFKDVSAPMQIHHGTADKDVPLDFSKKIFNALTHERKKAELYTYAGEGHEFGGAWFLAAERALQFFDHHLRE